MKPPRQYSASLWALCLLQLTAAQQQPADQQKQQPAAAPSPPVQQPKIGLAPHDRPACQLPPLQLANQRRLLSTEELGPTTNASSRPLATAASSKQFDSSERLRLLRGLLAQQNFDAYLASSSDEHGSEYVADVDRRVRFISGFSGSYGYALVLLDRAVLFTDGRYALQADMDLDCNWWLVVGEDPLADVHLWLRSNAAQGITVSSSARLMSMQAYDYLRDQIAALNSKFELTSGDLIDEVRDKLSSIYSSTDLSIVQQQQQQQTPIEPLHIHAQQFAGNISWQEKVVRVVESMTRLKARHYVISQLDEVAWLLNLRGNDIPQSPLFKAFVVLSVQRAGSPQAASAGEPAKPVQAKNPIEQLLLHQSQVSQFVRLSLFVDLRKIDQQVWDHLRVNNISLVQTRSQESGGDILTTRIQVDLEDYASFWKEYAERLQVTTTAASLAKQMQGRLLLSAGANVAIHLLAKDYEDRLVLTESLVQKLKAVKSDAEVQGMRLAHWRDSLAISMLLAQLDFDLGSINGSGSNQQSRQKWNEISAARELEFYRSLMDYNRGQSFDTISAYGPNGAVVHYRPNYEAPPGGEVVIGNQSTYLLDSGGQYLDGTTDITRTVHFGEPTEFQRETYTRVLMGSIDMMSLVFEQPRRSPYRINDLLARRHLFELGLDYAHGTGHGIGAYSLVHEAPALIELYSNFGSARKQQQQQRSGSAGGGKTQASVESQPILLQPNMFSSVEPGYYKSNDFGIRLENIVVTQRVAQKSSLSRPNDRHAPASATGGAAVAEKQYLRFEPISLVPFEPKLIKLELLSNKQKSWLNSYNLMVRLRMTQQINHYLTKIRNLPAPRQQFANGTTKDNGYYNFMRLEPAKLQEKLEHTHKWILAKTELIPLDVAPSLQRAASASTGALFGRRRDSQTDQTATNQRLMLAYMSSAPFNDADAGQAMASLNLQLQQQEQQRLLQLDGRAENSTTTSSNDDYNKCHGFECDIWLVSALNSQPAQAPANSMRHAAASIKRADAGWPTEMGDGSRQQIGGPSSDFASSLLDLFSLRREQDAAHSTGGLFSLTSLTTIGILSLIVLLQLGIMALMCKSSKSGKLRVRRPSTSGGRQQRNWCPANGVAACMEQLPTAGHAPSSVAPVPTAEHETLA